MKLLEGQTVGIDLGTTYSAVSQLNEAGVPISLKSAAGQKITPSIVLFEEQGKVLVGPSIERLAQSDPSWIVEGIKREMGNKGFFVEYDGQKLSPEFISGLILKKLKQDAESQIGPIANAVITVPYYFNDPCRKATQDAGMIAGLNVLDILNEPTAATLAYAWLRGELGRRDLQLEEKTIVVYDLGGGTFDVTLVRYTPTQFRVISTDGDVRLGGMDWTRRLVDHICEQFRRKFSIDPQKNPEAMLQFTLECEKVKRALSTAQQVPIDLPFEGRNLRVMVTRTEFERMTADLLQRTQDTIELVLESSDVDPTSLDEVLLVGGSTHMPAVERMLKNVCGRAPSRELDPDLAVAQGAAVHAAILEARETGGRSRMGQAVMNRLKSISTRDVNSHSLGVEITDFEDPQKKRNHIMIPRNTPIPHKVVQRFVTNTPNPESIRLRLLEGEVSDVSACTQIGEFRIVGLPENLPVGSPVELTYSYDSSGRIHVAGRELVGRSKSTTEIKRDSGLTDSSLDTFQALAREYKVE